MTSQTQSAKTPHMLCQRYAVGRWHEPKILKTDHIAVSPISRSINYGQAVFEGMKAYRGEDGGIAIFRPTEHLHRLRKSARRLRMPEIDAECCERALVDLIALDRAHCPDAPGTLYIRPLLFALDGDLRPHPSSEFLLIVTLCPMESFIGSDEGLRLTTTTEYVRAAPGGTGAVKCAGNYAATLPAIEDAKRDGFDEVLWLDAIHRRFVEEAGTMNIFVVRNGIVETPPVSDTILAGITRDSILELARASGLEAREAPVDVDPRAWRSVDEVFATGTAAGVRPVREIVHRGKALFDRAGVGPVCHDLGERLEQIHRGRGANARHHWLRQIPLNADAATHSAEQ